jgi:Recombination directionality factor-like
VSPIIELQRRMVEAGRIRAGEKGDKGQPQKLKHWRLTSKDRVRLDEAAKLWGGEVREWAERQGEFELYTETAALPIMLLPGQLPTTWFELWSKGGCQRRCDGQHELISDSSCLCGEERECKPHTRLSVLLPDLPGIGSWLLLSTGWNAAAELAGAADLLQRASAQGVLIPARLRLEERIQVQGGQTRRFSVPVLDIDIAFRDLLGVQGALSSPSEQRALPKGYTPITGNGGDGVSLEQGLAAAETQTTVRSARSAAPIPAQDDIPFGDAPIAVPVEPEAPSSAGRGSDTPPQASETAASPAPASGVKPPTKPQLTKLGVLVGKLRDETQLLSTEMLYAGVARNRKVDVTVMIDLTEGAYDPKGILHFGPLMATLTRPEASELIDQLEAFATKEGVN